MPRIAVIVFDLDNTLFDTRCLKAKHAHSLLLAIRSANSGPGAVNSESLEQAFEETWVHPFPLVAAKYALSTEVQQAWRNAILNLSIAMPLEPYPDTLPALTQLNLRKILLTTGYRHLQEAKIDALGLRSYFERIVVDAVDIPAPLGKERLLSELMSEFSCRADQVLVVGDSASSEIAAGRRLGMRTIQVLRPGIEPALNADLQVLSLTELPRVIEDLGAVEDLGSAAPTCENSPAAAV